MITYAFGHCIEPKLCSWLCSQLYHNRVKLFFTRINLKPQIVIPNFQHCTGLADNEFFFGQYFITLSCLMAKDFFPDIIWNRRSACPSEKSYMSIFIGGIIMEGLLIRRARNWLIFKTSWEKIQRTRWSCIFPRKINCLNLWVQPCVYFVKFKIGPLIYAFHFRVILQYTTFCERKFNQ